MASKATILIIDKEKMLADLLVHALKSNELSVVGVTTTENARRLAELNFPDLMLLDPTVPGALLFAEQFRKQNPFAKIVALVTSEEMRAEARAADIATCLDKAQGLDALVEAVRKALNADLPGLGGNGIRILVADDEDEIRNVITEFLKDLGYTVLTAKNGREAVELTVSADPPINLVLLDVSMPGMGGLEALSTIMAQERHPSVIMMTAVADREVARQALRTGAFDYILKPFDFASIEASIAACLSHTEYQKQPWWKRLTRRNS